MTEEVRERDAQRDAHEQHDTAEKRHGAFLPIGRTTSSSIAPAGHELAHFLQAGRVPHGPADIVRDLIRVKEDQPRNPRNLVEVDLLDVIAYRMIILVRSREEEDRRDLAPGKVEVVGAEEEALLR